MSWVLSLKVYVISDSETSSFLLAKMKSGIEMPFIVLFSTWGILFQQQHNSQMHFIRGNGFSINVQEVEFPVSYLFEYLCDLCTISSLSCVLIWHVHSEPQPDYSIRNSGGESQQSMSQQALEVIVLPLKFENHYCKASFISSNCEAMQSNNIP